MTLAEKIGQLVITGLDGHTLDDQHRRLLTDYHLGGFVLFARNIENPAQALALTNSLKEANRGNKAPLFVTVDEEGGRVSRLPDQFIKLPACMTIGGTADTSLAEKLGRVLARRVMALGINMNYAPVLDINSNPANPVIGDRSFGSDPDLVTRMGVETMKGIQAEGVIPVVKHFPGHGDTSVDSHFGLPRVDAGLDRLKNFELLPFREAIRSKADAVMTAHILLPRLDPNHPATLSQAVVTGLLRQELSFDGVVISDDLTMAAIKDNYSLGEAAVRAVNAGVDIVLVCHEYANYISVLTALKRGVEDGIIPEARVDEAVSRILRLKQRYCLRDDAAGQADIDSLNRSAGEILQRLEQAN